MDNSGSEYEVGWRLGVKAAITNHWVPPMMFGSAGKIYRLFMHIAPEDYCIITSNVNLDGVIQSGGEILPCAYHFLPSEWRRVSFPGNQFRSFFLWVNLWLKILQRARNMSRVLRMEKCKAVVTFTGECEDLPASFLAAKLAGCRFISVMDDDYINQWSEAHKRWFSHQIGPFIVRHADILCFVSEAMREEYKQRYGVEGHVLHTPTVGRIAGTPSQVPIGQENGDVRILFSGTVYELNADVVTSVIRASALITDRCVTVHVYTWQTRSQLLDIGVDGLYELHKTLSPKAIQDVQRQSDILFLGLGFAPQHRTLVRISFPSKLTDYLISGRPILSVLPPDSCTAKFLRNNQCGHVVDRPNVEDVADGIRCILEDGEYRGKLVRNAYAVARREFDLKTVVDGFVNLINEKPYCGEAQI